MACIHILFCVEDAGVMQRSRLLHKYQSSLVTGIELIADADFAIAQQLPHWSTAKLVEQPHSGQHALYRSAAFAALKLATMVPPLSIGNLIGDMRMTAEYTAEWANLG